MSYSEQSDEYRPLFWLSGRPIYGFTLLIILHSIACVVTAICMSVYGAHVLTLLSLSTPEILFGQVWRLVSYVVFPPSLWFLFAMGFLYFAGQQVEQYLGFKVFLKLYAALVLIPALLLFLLGFLWPMDYLGGTSSIYGVFVAFATIYPGLTLNIWFVNLTAKMWAWVLFAVYALIYLSEQYWTGIIMLTASGGVGYLGMRMIGVGYGFAWLTDWLDERRAARLAKQRNIKVMKETKAAESIDDILEKISKQGVGSLNSSERAALERARVNLLKRDQR